MTRLTAARLIVCIAALLFVAKPFVGFCLHGHLASPVKTNIVAKIFSKRKVEDGRRSMNAIQKQLSDPGSNIFLRFACLLAMVFPFAFKEFENVSLRFLKNLQLRLVPQPLALLNSQFLL